jgi:hypothetical protein
MSLRLATCLLLFCASLPVAARDFKMSGPNGDGGSCPEAISAGIVDDTLAPRAAKRSPVGAGGDRAAATRGAEAESVVRPPRWHSFLPGMFR